MALPDLLKIGRFSFKYKTAAAVIRSALVRVSRNNFPGKNFTKHHPFPATPHLQLNTKNSKLKLPPLPPHRYLLLHLHNCLLHTIFFLQLIFRFSLLQYLQAFR